MTEKLVRQRAQARWDALVRGDLAAAYEFLSEGSKKANPFELYRSRIQPGNWQQAVVQRVDCGGDGFCRVFVRIQMKLTVARIGQMVHESSTTETWTRDGDTWGFVHP